MDSPACKGPAIWVCLCAPCRCCVSRLPDFVLSLDSVFTYTHTPSLSPSLLLSPSLFLLPLSPFSLPPLFPPLPIPTSPHSLLSLFQTPSPQDVLATLLNNLKVQERQNRVCTTVAIAIVAETCSPFTVIPALMNEYRVPELNVQNGVLKSFSFLFEYIGEMGKDYIYAVTPLLEDALMDRYPVFIFLPLLFILTFFFSSSLSLSLSFFFQP